MGSLNWDVLSSSRIDCRFSVDIEDVSQNNRHADNQENLALELAEARIVGQDSQRLFGLNQLQGSAKNFDDSCEPVCLKACCLLPHAL